MSDQLALDFPRCEFCGKECKREKEGVTLGYGRICLFVEDGDSPSCWRRMCFECCGEWDEMCAKYDQRMMMYFTMEKSAERGMDYFVSNWPGSLKIKVYPKWKRVYNNFANKYMDRYDFRFSLGRKEWWGWHMADWSQIAHCRALKRKEKR